MGACAQSGGGRSNFLSGKMAAGESGVTLGQPHLSRQDLPSLVRFLFRRV
jgi:hypothetical protein